MVSVSTKPTAINARTEELVGGDAASVGGGQSQKWGLVPRIFDKSNASAAGPYLHLFAVTRSRDHR